MMQHHQQVIGELLDDISNLNSTIQYCRNKIFEKEKTIQQILEAGELREASEQESVSSVEKSVVQPVNSLPRKRVKFTEVARDVVSQLDTVFYYDTLFNKIVEKYPEMSPYKTRTYPAVATMLSAGQIERVPGGFKRKINGSHETNI